MLNKMLSSIGIGGAKVDTQLVSPRVRQGELVKGLVNVFGGKVDQEINDIFLEVKTQYRKEVNDRTVWIPVTIARFQIVAAFTIGAGEHREIPFSFVLPKETPLTLRGTKVWIDTDLDIKNAVDSADKDVLSVQPSPEVDAVLTTVQKLGFTLREIENKPDRSRRSLTRLPFVQEFEFAPSFGEFRGILDELELLFFPQSAEETVVMMQVDRKARSLSGFLAEALDMDESHLRFVIKADNIDSIPGMVHDLIYQHSR